MTIEQEANGVCPLCKKARGPVGDMCSNSFCIEQGYHYINASQLKIAMMDRLLGMSIRNYIIVGKIGEGGMGSVYLGLQMPLRRKVAVKVISGVNPSEDTVLRFEREARAVSLLNHPNIVQLYDFGVDESKGNLPYMVMEYIEGGRTMEDLVPIDGKPKTALPAEEIVRIFVQILNALYDAHQIGIIHRDIKPANIMLIHITGDENFVKILDFGLAKAVEKVSGIMDLTATGHILGTPIYLAPEQIVSSKGLNEKVDIYALGIMLFETLFGVDPYPAETAQDVIRLKLNPKHDPFALVKGKSFPPFIEPIIRKATARNNARRYASTIEMRDALLGGLDDIRKSETASSIVAEERRKFDALKKQAIEKLQGMKKSELEKDQIIERLQSQMESLRNDNQDLKHQLDDAHEASIEKLANEAGPESAPQMTLMVGDPKAQARKNMLIAVDQSQAVDTSKGKLIGMAGAGFAVCLVIAAVLYFVLGLGTGGGSVGTPFYLASTPPGAEAIVDGTSRGTTPLCISLDEGTTSIDLELKKEGFLSVTKSIAVEEAEGGVSFVLPTQVGGDAATLPQGMQDWRFE